MAIVKHLERHQPAVDAHHSETTCTYAIVVDGEGSRFLQVDTYGSNERRLAGKKSQSIRFAPAAIRELAEILRVHFPQELTNSSIETR